jgi:histidyl-tRNA synthetase
MINVNKQRQDKGVVSEEEAPERRPVLHSPRGMVDILPSGQKYWEYVLETAKVIFRGWDFQRMETPLVEETFLFVRSVGESSDIVAKELFEIKRRGGGLGYSLRPEVTAGMARAYIEHGMRSWPKPVKLYYIGPCFRYDRPQAGRQRQFHQLGLEVFGSVAPVTEVELIYVTHIFLSQLGLERYRFRINTLGDSQDRKTFTKQLRDHFRHHRTKLCRDCKVRLKDNPLRLLDCKEEKCQQVARMAPRLLDNLSEEAKAHFEKVIKMLDSLAIPYEVTPSLVRGLDYYTRTVWEVVPTLVSGEEDMSSQSSLAGGGRYDNLVKQLGGRPTAGVGMSAGVERIIEQIKTEGIELTVTDGPQVFVAQLGDQAKLCALKIMKRLQEGQIRFAESVDREGMQPQLKLADRLGVKWVLVVGQKEALDGTIILRNMESGMQEVINQDEVVADLQRRLNLRRK